MPGGKRLLLLVLLARVFQGNGSEVGLCLLLGDQDFVVQTSEFLKVILKYVEINCGLKRACFRRATRITTPGSLDRRFDFCKRRSTLAEAGQLREKAGSNFSEDF